MNIGSLLGDMNFWAGVGEGFMTETNRQRDLKEKNYRELRNYGIESGLQIKEENNKALDATEAEVKKVASLIAGDRAVGDKVVREAALYLINQEGSIDGAQRIAKKYSTEHSTYGRDPIAAMGLTERADGETPDYRGIARTYTKLKPLPDISATSGATEQTALDVIFGGETATEMAQKDIESIVGQTETQAAFMPVSATGYDEQMILSADYDGELTRMKIALKAHDNISEDKRDAAWESKHNRIKANIDLLKDAQKQTKLAGQVMTDSTRKSFTTQFMTQLLLNQGLKGEWQLGQYIPSGVQANIQGIASTAVSKHGEAVQWARNNGYFGLDPETGETNIDPITFVQQYGVGSGKNIIIVTEDDVLGPHLKIGDDIFDSNIKNSQAWKQSTGGSSATPPPPPSPNNTTSTTTTGTTSTTTAPTATSTTSTTSSQVQIPLQMQGAVANNVKDYKAAPDTNSKGKIINRILKLKIPGLTTTKEVTDWLATQ